MIKFKTMHIHIPTGPSPDTIRVEFARTIEFSAALFTVAANIASEAIDLAADARTYAAHPGVTVLLRQLDIYITEAYRRVPDVLRRLSPPQADTSHDAAWFADFGMSLARSVEPTLRKLQYSIANELGRIPGLDSPNTYARIIIAQSVLDELGKFGASQARHFRGVKVQNRYGAYVSAPNIIATLTSPRASSIARRLVIAIGNLYPEAVRVDLTRSRPIIDGCHAFFNLLSDPAIWQNAIHKAWQYNQNTITA